MNKRILAFLTTIVALCGNGASARDLGWKALFNGEDLSGWTQFGGEASYSVEDGAIVGVNGTGPNTFLCTDETYGDFELEFEVKLESPLNSGVQIRSRVREDEHRGQAIRRVYGPQVEIEQSPGEAGYVYGEGMGGGWRTPEKELIRHDAFENAGWNQYRIVARGPRIQTYVNGQQIADLYDPEAFASHPSGRIGLQVHQTDKPTGTLQVAWRNIRIRETDTEGWTSLFNGKDLSGWTPKVKGYEAGENPGRLFRVKDGVLTASYDQFDSFDEHFGHLFYEKPYSHFILRAEYRFVGDQVSGGPDWAFRNNGFMIHGQSPESMALEQSFPTSIEVQLLGAVEGKERSTGNVCTPDTLFYQDGERIERHCVNSNSRSYYGDQWVQIEIEVNGSDEIAHIVNGAEVMRYQNIQHDDGTPLESGTISIQAESHPTEFRFIEVKEL